MTKFDLRWKLFRHSKVYLLPTRFGIVYIFVLLAMLLVAASYANNLVYLLSFILISTMIASLIKTHYNLKGVVVRRIEVHSNHVDEDLEFVIYLSSMSHEAKLGLHVNLKAGGVKILKPGYLTILEPSEQAPITIVAKGASRGAFDMSHVRIESEFPIGLWRAWSVFKQEIRYCVYPKRLGKQALPEPTRLVENLNSKTYGSDDFTDHRAFQDGDSYRHIDWKARARGLPLLVKRFTGGDEALRVLDLAKVRSENLETRLMQLSAWVDQCNQMQKPFGLKLPGVNIEPNIGLLHYKRCQESLAQFGGRDGNAS